MSTLFHQNSSNFQELRRQLITFSPLVFASWHFPDGRSLTGRLQLPVFSSSLWLNVCSLGGNRVIRLESKLHCAKAELTSAHMRRSQIISRMKLVRRTTYLHTKDTRKFYFPLREKRLSIYTRNYLQFYSCFSLFRIFILSEYFCKSADRYDIYFSRLNSASHTNI